MAALLYETIKQWTPAVSPAANTAKEASPKYKPRVIIHGGAGNISRSNLPKEQWEEYKASLLRIVLKTNELLTAKTGEKTPGVDALTGVVYAVKQLEDDPLFNAGVGAVFTREGRVELEASVMVSGGPTGARKRGVGVSGLRHVRSPVALAAKVLSKGDEEGGGGGQGHLQLHGEYVEGLARKWGLEMCDENVFWTRRRWEEHKRGLEREERERDFALGADSDPMENTEGPSGRWDAPHVEPDVSPDGENWTWPTYEPGWDGHEYLPQGTVGCVVLDEFGTIAVATSTGGLTNKLPGRLGDTPTLGAGFWAEGWEEEISEEGPHIAFGNVEAKLSSLHLRPQILPGPNTWPGMKWQMTRNLASLDPSGIIRKCIAACPGIPSYLCLSSNRLADEYQEGYVDEKARPPFELKKEPLLPLVPSKCVRAVAMSGTGNGDSFLKLAAARTTAALVRFSGSPHMTLADAVKWMAGPNGELQKSAEDRWGKTGEGEGGIIGIELRHGKGHIVADFNRGMFRAWVDEDGKARCMVFKDDY